MEWRGSYIIEIPMNYLVPLSSLGVLCSLFFLQVFRKNVSDKMRVLISKWAFIFSMLGVVFWYIFLTASQYFLWIQSGAPFIYFLPPHESILYLFQYHFVRFLMYYCISFIIGILLVFYGRRYNKKFSSKFFEDEELYIGGVAIFLLGNPAWMYGWIFYLIAVFLGGLIGTVYINKIQKKPEERFSLYYLWSTLAIIAIIISELVIRN